MAKRRALIVDDSKTAQMRLRKMLERFDLEVDTVFSAEEALGYLSYRMPAVIFLDHHMEGMDGLEALKIIKSNPATALIPVIMYTSEKGDVYVGQARALGAMDILGKEVMKHASLEKVLGSLGISSASGEESKETQEPETSTEAKAAPQEPAPTPKVNKPKVELEDERPYSPIEEPDEFEHEDQDNLYEVQQQISRLFEIHIAKVRQEIEQSTKFLVRRLAKEEKAKKITQAEPQAAAAEPEPFIYPEEKSSGVSLGLLGIILIGIGFLGYHLYINNKHQEILQDQYGELIDRTKAQEALISRLFERVTEIKDAQPSPVDRNFADRQILLDAMGWAVNVNTQVGFGEQALNDERIYMLGELLTLLKAANFNGVIYLDVHLGNYCVAESASGQLVLPEPESNLEDCVFMSAKIPEVNIGNQVSVGFMNYLQSAPILAEGNIEVELGTQGYTMPRFTYPAATGAVSAGQWNDIATKNNRISVSFSAY